MGSEITESYVLTSGLKPMVDSNQAETERVHNEQHSGVSRRRLLRTIAAGVGSTATALYINSDDVEAAASDEVPIVIGFESKDPDRPHESFGPVKKNVPADWYNDLQRAEDVNEKVKNRYLMREGVVGIGVSPGSYGGENSSVFVDILPKYIGELGGEIPEQVDGVPIEVQERSEITPDGHSPCDSGNSNCNNYDTRPGIPGGFVCWGDRDQGQGTFMSRMYDENGNRRFATASHLFTGSDANGTDIWHPDDNSNVVATVVRTHCYQDFVLGKEKNGNYPQRRIDGANPEPVNGQFTKTGVQDLKAQGEYIHKIGVTSCKTCGLIESADYTHTGYGCTPKDGQVKWGEGDDSQPGDSGAPVYHVNPNNSSYQWIVSFDLWSGCCSAGGTGAWKIKNTHSYHF